MIGLEKDIFENTLYKDLKMNGYCKYAAVVPFFIIFLFSSNAFAYVGPGLASGTVAAVLGILAGIFMLIVGVIWYPIKRLYRRFISKDKE